MDAELYDAFNVVEDKHWWFVARRAYIHRCLSRLMPSDDGSLKLAEIGAGTGGNFDMLTQFGKLDAVEMDQKAISLAAKKADGNDRVTALESGCLPDNIRLSGQYDCVLALDVIEHVRQDEEAVKTLISLLKPNGLLLVTVPAYQWLWSAHDEVNHHYRRYTAGKLRQLFENSGVKILKLGYFNTLLFPVAVVRRLSSRWMNDSRHPQADLDLPGRLTNQCLKFIFSLESHWAGLITMPFGLSLIIIVQKNDL